MATHSLFKNKDNYMAIETVSEKGLVLLGCGKMGSAMLQGWLADGLGLNSVYVLDPFPSQWVLELEGKGFKSKQTSTSRACRVHYSCQTPNDG
jgi:hypothetical protein